MSTTTRTKTRDQWSAAIEEEERNFETQLEELLSLYEGEYVAMYRGKVEGHSKDDSDLFGEMHAKLGYVPFMIQLVSREPEVINIEMVGNAI